MILEEFLKNLGLEEYILKFKNEEIEDIDVKQLII